MTSYENKTKNVATKKNNHKGGVLLPPTVPISVKTKTGNVEVSSTARKDSFASSLEGPQKRSRSGSISGRLRSASDLEERGVINRYQKRTLKDLIISGDGSIKAAIEKFQNGDSSALIALADSGAFNRESSLDLLDDLDFGFLNVGSLNNTPNEDNVYSAPTNSENLEDWDDLKFDTAFADMPHKNLYDAPLGASLANSLPSMGMGITPPNPFGLSEQFLDRESDELGTSLSKGKENSQDNSFGNGTTRPIGIPGSSKSPCDTKKCVGNYSPKSRRRRIEKFLEKRGKRVWTKKVKYDVRKNFADSRLRVKGRFVKKEDEQLLRELLSMT